MSLTQLTERARVPRAQVFRAFQALLVPLAPLGVVREKGWACRRALRARRAVRIFAKNTLNDKICKLILCF